MTAAAVVAIAVVAVLVVHDRSRGAGPGLSLPHTLGKGRYTLLRDTSSSSAQDLWRGGSDVTEHMTAVSGSYRRILPSGDRDLLDLDGGYGTVKDSARAVKAMFAYAEETGGDDVAVLPATITPTGSARPVTCEVVSNTSDADQRAYLPVCAWADSSTVAVVSRTDYSDLATTAAGVDLRAFADLASTVRAEAGDRP